jgi:hypothetical protein
VVTTTAYTTPTLIKGTARQLVPGGVVPNWVMHQESWNPRELARAGQCLLVQAINCRNLPANRGTLGQLIFGRPLEVKREKSAALQNSIYFGLDLVRG